MTPEELLAAWHIQQTAFIEFRDQRVKAMLEMLAAAHPEGAGPCGSWTWDAVPVPSATPWPIASPTPRWLASTATRSCCAWGGRPTGTANG